MGYVRGFIPWVVSGVVSAVDWRWGALGGLLAALLLLALERRRGVGLDALILELGAAVYFVVIGAVAVATPDSALAGHADPASFGWLAAVAWGGLAIRRPFTLGIARRQTPREYWDMPEFIQVNNRITAVWGAGFTVICGGLAVCDALNGPVWVAVAIRVAGLLGPAVFTKVYPARAQARLRAQAPVHHTKEYAS